MPTYFSKVFLLHVLIILTCTFQFGKGVSVWKDITLTENEKAALETLKIELENVDFPHKYMKEDIFLIKWLRAYELDVPVTVEGLKRHLEWRKANRMDTIVDEDFGSIVYEYAYSTDGKDFEDRPVLALNAADWDIRRGILAGKREDLTRWAFRAFEVGSRTVRQAQAEGKNVTQFVMVCNFDGFNLVQHVCPQCIDVLVNFLLVYEQNFPGMADSIIAIKTPQSFEILLRALTAVMSRETREAVKIWGPNPKEWRINLLKQIPANQLDEEFGGTRNNI